MASKSKAEAEIEAMKTDFQNKIDANSAALDALKQLVDGILPELTAIGQDVAGIKGKLGLE